MTESQNHDARAQFACSLWLHAGFIGATVLAAGLLQLLDAETTWYSALALAFFGGVLAAASWHRGRIVIERAERAATANATRNEPKVARQSCYPPVPMRTNVRFNDDHGYPTPE